MGAPLKNPPLIEAACELRFAAGLAWRETSHLEMQARLAADYSSMEFVDVVDGIVPAGAPPHPQVQTHTRCQLKRNDGKAMVQLDYATPSPTGGLPIAMLIINHLQPYDGWNVYRALILDIVRAHVDIFGDTAIQGVGMRYINFFNWTTGMKLGELLSVRPPLRGILYRPLANFVQRYELMRDDVHPGARLIHQTGMVVVEGRPGILLDLDLVSPFAASTAQHGALGDWLDRMHDVLGDTFVASLAKEKHDELLRGGQ